MKKLKKIISSFLVFLVLMYNIGQSNFVNAQNTTCSLENNGQNIKFCAKGFPNRASAENHYFEAYCIENCSSNYVEDFMYDIFGSSQVIYINQPFLEDDGTWSACFSPGGWDESVINTYNQCLDPYKVEQVLGNPVCVGALAISLPVAISPLNVSIPFWVSAACAAGGGIEELEQAVKAEIERCGPKFNVRLMDNVSWGSDIVSCEIPVEFQGESVLSIEESTSEGKTPTKPFSLCDQIPADQAANKAECLRCVGGATVTEDDSSIENQNGVWTALGCIQREPTNIIQQMIKIGLGMAGGFTLLTFLAAGFQYSIAQNDAKMTAQAREQITASLIGLLFILFSVTILQFIGSSVLKIPGFGG